MITGPVSVHHDVDQIGSVGHEHCEEKRAITANETVTLNMRRNVEMMNAPIIEHQIEIGAFGHPRYFCGSTNNVAAEVFFEVSPLFDVLNDLSKIARALRSQRVLLKGSRLVNCPWLRP